MSHFTANLYDKIRHDLISNLIVNIESFHKLYKKWGQIKGEQLSRI